MHASHEYAEFGLETVQSETKEKISIWIGKYNASKTIWTLKTNYSWIDNCFNKRP